MCNNSELYPDLQQDIVEHTAHTYLTLHSNVIGINYITLLPACQLIWFTVHQIQQFQRIVHQIQ